VTTPPESTYIQTLIQELASCDHIPSRAQWIRLHGGRTNHVWRVTGPEGGDPVVVKLYDKDADNPLFPNRPEDEARVLRALEGRGLAPRLLHHMVTRLGPCLIYSHLEGAAWRRDPKTAAALLHRVHRVTPPQGLRLPPDGSIALEQQIIAILGRLGKSLADLPNLPSQEIKPSGAACLLHGDPVPGNMIDCGERLMLIDWQCPAIGDPCEDIALFLSPAMQIAYRGEALSKTDESAFLSAYDDTETLCRYARLAPWYHARTLAYCLWQVEQGESAASDRAEAEHRALIMATRRTKAFDQK
jgi:tRNA A-37 threonylcarbamoyl transferase component Bud32